MIKRHQQSAIPRVPVSLDVSLTGKCNLRCQYCFYADAMATLDDLPTDSWRAFFAEAGAAGVRRLTLSGGEVFTRSDLFILVDSVIKNGMRYSILTNGTLISEVTIAAFNVGKRRRRLNSIQVSIDGSSSAIHDLSRPPASFERALRGLRLLKANDLPVTARVTINHHNVHDLPNIAQLLLDDIGLRFFSTNSADLFGSARCRGRNVLLSPEEWRVAVRTTAELARNYPGRITAAAGPLSFAEDTARIESALASGAAGLPGRGTLSACGGVFSKMAILHNGAIVPCNMLPTMVMGKIGFSPLDDVWLNGKEINILRERYETPITSISGCSDCRYAGFCTGGCPAVVYGLYGRLDAVDPGNCYKKYREESHVPL